MDKRKRIALGIFSLLLAITGITLACIWFSWKLALIIFLLIWSNNVDRSIALKKSFENYSKALNNLINGK